MIPQPRFTRRALRRLVIALLAAVAVAALLGSCADDDPPEDCWMAVDTVYVSNMAVADTAGVRAVFEAYVDSVTAAGGDFPGDDSDLRYVGSRFNKEWRGRRYWEVTHSAEFGNEGRFLRRTLQVDENGVLVGPLGCI